MKAKIREQLVSHKCTHFALKLIMDSIGQIGKITQNLCQS